ncbi:DUF488 family protein [Adhaeribacter terreus]|uniref:DUF488 family protein n=1 Tax=Adhaeribacter terreus TaxID=529703 RepID=A0ABW0EBI3_9BACT
MAKPQPEIWTIGHSTRSQEDFLETLLSFGIEALADVRRFPGSRKYPQFNAGALENYLPETGIAYQPFPELGGRRKPNPDSKNTIWTSASFRAYADYTETTAFAEGISRLTELAVAKRTAYMCSEAVWWRCHRALISDYLKERNWKVMHIMKAGDAREHPFTAAYRELHHITK